MEASFTPWPILDFGTVSQEAKMYIHHPVVAIVDEKRFQAICNPTKCGWFGSVTDSKPVAELERENHRKEALAFDSKREPE
jgi:hypothetical protein